VQYLRCRFAITAACAAGFVAGASADRAGEPLSATPTVETVYLNAQSLEELRIQVAAPGEVTEADIG
jgi:hypothetical protein